MAHALCLRWWVCFLRKLRQVHWASTWLTIYGLYKRLGSKIWEAWGLRTNAWRGVWNGSSGQQEETELGRNKTKFRIFPVDRPNWWNKVTTINPWIGKERDGHKAIRQMLFAERWTGDFSRETRSGFWRDASGKRHSSTLMNSYQWMTWRPMIPCKTHGFNVDNITTAALTCWYRMNSKLPGSVCSFEKDCSSTNL